MLKAIKKLIPIGAKVWLRKLLGSRAYASSHFSQEGEDVLLSRIFNDTAPGIYVDIGAHHPFRFSNTFVFYRRGWRGINVDAMPDSMAAFHKHRPQDTNLEVGIAGVAGYLSFHVFSEPALNTFDANVAQFRIKAGNALIRTVKVECLPLSEIVRRHLVKMPPRNSFLSVDVEGLDLQVLKSNDWSIFKPSVIIAEVDGKNIADLLSDEVTKYLESQGYQLFSKLGHSVFFKRLDFEII
ncbi:MAG: FkbM family methyltransferase [Aquabacterium sp.]|nr:FkbM family methyltransferase [Aquabacterium sp.]